MALFIIFFRAVEHLFPPTYPSIVARANKLFHQLSITLLISVSFASRVAL
jgi:hypothetical protein